MVLSDPELTQAVSKILLCSEWVASVAERFQLDNDNNQILYGCRAPVSNLSNRRSGRWPAVPAMSAGGFYSHCPARQWQATELGLPARPGALNPHTTSEWGS